MGKKRAFGDPDNNRKSNRTVIMRCVKLLDYLKHNTDRNHTVSQEKLRSDFEISEHLGSKSSFNSRVRDLALALNTDESGDLLPLSDWRIGFNALKKYYETHNGETDEDTIKSELRTIRNIYYNHPFTEDEVTDIINSIHSNKMLESRDVKRLIGKAKQELASKYYKEPQYHIDHKEQTDTELLQKNLRILQNAINNRQQIGYIMNYYNSNKLLIPVRSVRKAVSPYYIIANNGRYYLVCCFENKKDTEKKLTNIRIDLMTDIVVKRAAVTPVHKIYSLSQDMENGVFRSRHVNMGYDKPDTVTLRITKKINDDINYTFIHDCFGDNYKFLRHDGDGDIIEVRSSAFGVVSFAMQYNDVVEVVAPEKIRNEVQDKIIKLMRKYNV